MKLRKLFIAAAVFLSGLSFVGVELASAQDLLPDDNGLWNYHKPPRYRESESHPLRIGAYILHPVGWALREGVFRPLSYFFGSTRNTRSIFGFREPFDFRDPLCFNEIGVPDCNTISPFNQTNRGSDAGSLVDAPADRQVYFPDINFEFDRSSLTPLGKGRVRQVSQLLASVPSLKVVVEGHADAVGTDDYNMKLGTRRAQTVIKELTELGIDPVRISPVSYGEARPVFTEDEAWARAVNRRVQFTVAGAEPAGAPVSGN